MVDAVFLVSADAASDNDNDGVDDIAEYADQRRQVGVGHKLVLSNITRDSDDVFECHADNGVPPPTRKTFHVTVECKHLLVITVPHISLPLYTSATFDGNILFSPPLFV